MPQLFLWLVMSKQAPLQFVKPMAQLPVVHAPFEQIWVPVQVRPHWPQFDASDATQAPLHSRKLLGQAQVPLLQL
jgi:hypothetical protein